MNNSVYRTSSRTTWRPTPTLATRCDTLEHEAPVALGDKLDVISHVHPAGSTDQFGAALTDRPVITLTYAVGDETKAVAALFAL